MKASRPGLLFTRPTASIAMRILMSDPGTDIQRPSHHAGETLSGASHVAFRLNRNAQIDDGVSTLTKNYLDFNLVRLITCK